MRILTVIKFLNNRMKIIKMNKLKLIIRILVKNSYSKIKLRIKINFTKK